MVLPRIRKVAATMGACLMVGGASLAWRQMEAGAASPSVTITPVAQAGSGPGLHNGEVVTVSVGRNSVFTPGLKVNILECSDPGGTAAALPKSISGCDGETIQGDTVLVQPGGSISEKQYTIYQLPSSALGEQANGQPVCNQSNECVLYVGENQEDFNQPKLFSAPFEVAPAAGSIAPAAVSGSSAGGASATSSPPADAPTPVAASGAPSPGAPATASPTAGTFGAPGALAYTGPPRALPWLLVVGGFLIIAGSTGRRLLGARR
jgi:hypothetical protein